VNPNHAITRNLLKVYAASPEDPFLALSIENLFDSALLLDGYLADPHALTSRTTRLLDQPRLVRGDQETVGRDRAAGFHGGLRAALFCGCSESSGKRAGRILLVHGGIVHDR
jgi:hypothetical protein